MKVAVIGHGVVGSGVAELLFHERKRLEEKAGTALELGYVLDIKDLSHLPYKDSATLSLNSILEDKEVGVVVETIGGISPAFEYSKACLEAGKHVVTANKELVAEKGAELLALAKNNGVNYKFEASVGGGTPMIRPLHKCLSTNKILSVAGILNGTSNFILTKMFGEGAPFLKVLKEAQELGYAEADPSADVDGLDTGRKICILASIISGKHVYPKNIHMEGIRSLSHSDVAMAEKLQMSIRLLGYIRPVGNKLEVLVAPMLIPNPRLLSQVSGVYNGVEYVGDAVDDVLLYGKGAGKFPTASAVLGDVLECVHLGATDTMLGWEEGSGEHVLPFGQVICSRIVRFKGKEEAVTSVFPKAQVQYKDGELIVFETPPLSQDVLQSLLEKLGAYGTVEASLLLLPTALTL